MVITHRPAGVSLKKKTWYRREQYCVYFYLVLISRVLQKNHMGAKLLLSEIITTALLKVECFHCLCGENYYINWKLKDLQAHGGVFVFA